MNGRLGAAHPSDRLVPLPQQVTPRDGSLLIDAHSRVVAGHGLDPMDPVVVHLVADVQSATGLHLRRTTEPPARGDIAARIDPASESRHGDEGYELTIGNEGAEVVAATRHGLWNGTRTLVQLFSHSAYDGELPAVHIVDRPRFEWRGAMLDVARHFFGVDHVLRFVELMARFKLNRLHLHLSDDQGWRLAIDGWPALTGVGASTAVGGDYGGFFSRADYLEIVAHAARHFVTVVPEIDMPGHTNAALASVPELNLDGVAPPLYTGVEVGFSSLHLAAPATHRFVHEVVAQLAADTPGEYLHIGGDEAHSTDHSAYLEFVALLQHEVHSHGKKMIGWEEVAAAPLTPATLVQHWLHPAVAAGAPSGTRFVMSPARHTYLDMKHTPDCHIGRRWAGFIDLATAYEWDPAALIDGVGDDRIAGVEAPLWTERVVSFADVEHLCYPRLACLAEVGWTGQALRTWNGFRPRLQVHSDRLAAIGVNVYRPLET